MPSGSSAYFYLLADQSFSPFLALPKQISEGAWNQLWLKNDASGLLQQAGADEAALSLWDEPYVFDEEAEERLQMLLDWLLEQTALARLIIDVPQMFQHMFFNGITTVEPMPKSLLPAWQAFQQIFDRRLHPVPAWLEQACPEDRTYLGLLNPAALQNLYQQLVNQGLLDWLIHQLELKDPEGQQGWVLNALELRALADFLTPLPASPCWLLVTEPKS